MFGRRLGCSAQEVAVQMMVRHCCGAMPWKIYVHYISVSSDPMNHHRPGGRTPRVQQGPASTVDGCGKHPHEEHRAPHMTTKTTGTHHDFPLGRRIVELSEADDWDRARLEWRIEDIYIQRRPETCLCGHFPINELCVLRNKKNHNKATVGNVCVKKFMKLPSERMFDAIKRVTADETKAFNVQVIEHSFAKHWINDWEKKFYLDTWRKRNLSGPQLAKRREINRKVLAQVRTNR